MLARAVSVPVVVCSDRVAGAHYAVKLGADVLISDDGLQHYRLARDAEIVVVDGQYGFGNRRCLPAGPLREPMSRLSFVDLLLSKNPARGEPGYALEPTVLRRLDGSDSKVPNALSHEASIAIAGIGQPESFFSTLDRLGYSVECYAFPDHYSFGAEDFAGLAERTVITTAKDAVRIEPQWCPNLWYLETEARLNQAARGQVEALLDKVLP
jgi:tetraacyldisaccharide 4'-kinase